MKRLRNCCSCASTIRLQLEEVLQLQVEESLQLYVNIAVANCKGAVAERRPRELYIIGVFETKSAMMQLISFLRSHII